MFIQPPTRTYQIALPLSGVLLKAGKPMSKAKLIRKLEWNGDKEGTKDEVFYTDENGAFTLPEFNMETTMRGLEQFVAKTELYVEIPDGAPELFWYSSTMKDNLGEELGYALDALTCDISNKEAATQGRPLYALTRCRWENMPEIVEVD